MVTVEIFLRCALLVTTNILGTPQLRLVLYYARVPCCLYFVLLLLFAGSLWSGLDVVDRQSHDSCMTSLNLLHWNFDNRAQLDHIYRQATPPLQAYRRQHQVCHINLTIMSSLRLLSRSLRTSNVQLSTRAFSSSSSHLAGYTAGSSDTKKSVPLSSRVQDTAEDYRRFMMEKPLNPHMTNTTSTIANEMPSLGSDNPPPELITSADPSATDFKDSVPENTQRMTGGTQSGAPESGPNSELGVGEIEGSSIKVEPNKREGEDIGTIRARLLCPFLHIIPTLPSSLFHTSDTTASIYMLIKSPSQTRVGSAEPSSLISSSPPSPTTTYPI